MYKTGIVIFVILLHASRLLLAGVSNPNISVIGQIISKHSDDNASEDAHNTTFNLGETELIFDAYLNPYSKGLFVFTVGDDGLKTEEAFINIYKGLPDGIALKGGKYRIGFGKLNSVHPHAYSFIDPPRVMTAMLPGDDGYNETGGQVSYLLPVFGSWASNISVDIINGASWHPDEIKSAAGWVGRCANSFLINDNAPLDIGVSATQGTNNVYWKTKTSVYGADIKTKVSFSNFTNMTLQGEYFNNDSDVIVDSTTGSFSNIARQGFYVFADMKFAQRWNAGAIYDQYQPQENKNLTNRAIKYFIGFSLLEETTLFRLSYEQFFPDGLSVVNTCMFQIIFSMGPHKAHQF